jgi:CubicO group peptidase (beta-lactamase class C family)
MSLGSSLGHGVEFMNPNSELPPVLGSVGIREILEKRVDHQKQAVGIVVGVIEPTGRRVVAYGNLAKGDQRKLDGDTIFEIGSVSKVFTSLLLADMVSRKEVSLDDPAAKYLPISVTMPERSGKFITLLDLSTHRSGLPPLPGNLKPGGGVYTVDDLYQFLSGYTLPRNPGSEYEYSNLGGGLLGHVLSYYARTDFGSLIQTRITQPLGMSNTAITLSSSMERRMATGHTATLAPVANSEIPAPLAGAGALRSSANDMLTFLEAFLDYRESPLSPAMKAMLEVRRPAGEMMIGLGWLIHSIGGRKIVWHNGATGGFRSFIGYDAKERSGVVVLSNASSSVDDIGFHLLNAESALANPEPPTLHTEIHIDSKLLDNYTGRYQVTPHLVFEITRDGDRLFAQGFAQLPHGRPGILTGLPKFELFAEGEKTFFARVSDNQIAFETGPDGRATILVLRRAGRNMPAAPRLS